MSIQSIGFLFTCLKRIFFLEKKKIHKIFRKYQYAVLHYSTTVILNMQSNYFGLKIKKKKK